MTAADDGSGATLKAWVPWWLDLGGGITHAHSRRKPSNAPQSPSDQYLGWCGHAKKLHGVTLQPGEKALPLGPIFIGVAVI